jgi:hypothetical protein
MSIEDGGVRSGSGLQESQGLGDAAGRSDHHRAVALEALAQRHGQHVVVLDYQHRVP